MAATYLGSLSIGACIPGPVVALGLALPDLQARVAALVAFSPGSVDFAASIAICEGIIASLQLAITLGVTPPSIAAQIALVTNLLAALEALLALILAQTSLYAGAGIDAWAVDGTASNLATQWAGVTSGGFPSGGGASLPAHALILATGVGATWSAMGQVFKVTP